MAAVALDRTGGRRAPDGRAPARRADRGGVGRVVDRAAMDGAIMAIDWGGIGGAGDDVVAGSLAESAPGTTTVRGADGRGVPADRGRAPDGAAHGAVALEEAAVAGVGGVCRTGGSFGQWCGLGLPSCRDHPPPYPPPQGGRGRKVAFAVARKPSPLEGEGRVGGGPGATLRPGHWEGRPRCASLRPPLRRPACWAGPRLCPGRDRRRPPRDGLPAIPHGDDRARTSAGGPGRALPVPLAAGRPDGALSRVCACGGVDGGLGVRGRRGFRVCGEPGRGSVARFRFCLVDPSP